MFRSKEQYLTDAKGKQVGVVLDLRQYRKLLEQAEELDAIRAYDSAKASREKPVAFEQAIKEIEHRHRK